MTKMCKRAAALFLAVCLMLPVMVPSVWAADTEQTEAAATVTVDYDLYYSGLAFGNTGASLANTDNKEVLEKQYGIGTNFMLVGYNNAVSGKTPYVNSTENSNVAEANRFLNGLLFNSKIGDWIAFKIKSPGDGSYNVSINYLYSSSNTDGCAVYLFADDNNIKSEEISGELNSATLLGTANLGLNLTAADLGNEVGGEVFNFEKGKDYIVVFKVTKDKSGNSTGDANAYMRIRGLTMTQSGSLSTELANISGASSIFHAVTLNASDSLNAAADVSNAAITVSQGAELNLNGYTLTAGFVKSFGNIVDRSEKDKGVLTATNVVFSSNNSELPLKSSANSYRFFSFNLNSLGRQTNVADKRFWFELIFDAKEEAYNLINSADNAGLEIQFDLYWNDTLLDLGANVMLAPDKVQSWANNMADGQRYGIYVNVTGFPEAGTFGIAPKIVSNGVTYTANTMTYEHTVEG